MKTKGEYVEKDVKQAAADIGVPDKNVEQSTERFERINKLVGATADSPKAMDLLMSASQLTEAAIRTGDFSDADRRIERLEKVLGVDKANEQKTGPKDMSPETAKSIEDYVSKVRGPEVKTLLEKELPGGASGMFTKAADGKRMVSIALSALSPLSVAHHEAMHDFFSELAKNGDAKTQKLLTDAANSPLVRAQLEKRLDGETKALAQLDDPEERAAYMYQFWAAGKLRLGPKADGLFQKVANWIRNSLGLLRNDQKAEMILKAFHNGDLVEHSAVGKVLDTAERREAQVAHIVKKLQPIARGALELLGTSEGHLQGSPNPHLNEIGTEFNNKVGSRDEKQGLLQATEQKRNQYGLELKKAVGGSDAEAGDVQAAFEGMQRGEVATDPVERKAQQGIRRMLDNFHDYLAGSGMKIGHIKDYLPQVWDTEKVQKEAGRFQDLMLEHHRDTLEDMAKSWEAEKDGVAHTAEDVAQTIVQRLITSHGAPGVAEKESSLGYTPFMSAINERTLNFLKKDVFAEFQQKDFAKTMTSYIAQGVHRAEYSRRFGDDGSILQTKMEKALEWEKQRNGGDEMEALKTLGGARRAVMAMEGTLGYDISPTLRRASSVAIVYQNYRTLTMSLFSNLIDPLGVVVRGGTMNDAFNTFKRGMQEVVAGWKGKEIADEGSRLAEAIGTIGVAGFFDGMGSVNSSIYMHGAAKKMNDKLFRWNGVEGLNRGVRIGATQAAIGFIKRHVEAPNEHSKRYLEELYGKGVNPKSIKIQDGRLDTDDPRTQQAIMRWVDGAVLRPNASMRTNWMSDPHYALIAHLKTFTYAFQKVILSRAMHEMKNGNTDPLYTLGLAYVPTMLAVDTVRGILQGATGAADTLNSGSVADHMSQAVQRSGLLGVSQFAEDVHTHGLGALGGPSLSQLLAIPGQSVGQNIVQAIPNPIAQQLATTLD